jgi:hypothetical protein
MLSVILLNADMPNVVAPETQPRFRNVSKSFTMQKCIKLYNFKMFLMFSFLTLEHLLISLKTTLATIKLLVYIHWFFIDATLQINTNKLTCLYIYMVYSNKLKQGPL